MDNIFSCPNRILRAMERLTKVVHGADDVVASSAVSILHTVESADVHPRIRDDASRMLLVWRRRLAECNRMPDATRRYDLVTGAPRAKIGV